MRWFSLLLVGYAICYYPAFTLATPANHKSLENYLGPYRGKSLNCVICHLPEPPDAKFDLESNDKPHNSFGIRLKAVRKELQKAGKQYDMEARLTLIAGEDSDGDGISNLIELLLGHQPGNKGDIPNESELKSASKLLGDFASYQRRYPWKPFGSVTRPTLPTSASAQSHPIDLFIEEERSSVNLLARSIAPKEVLLRRLYIDLIGLPPTHKELRSFMEDGDSNAFEKQVDRLLADPRHAQRWARHWMDVWRYSDWAGFGAEIRESQPHIWRWRDWIVDSLQTDKGYDRMIQEMLAGDELSPEDPNTLRATGFLVRQWYKFNRNVWLDQAVEHTSKAFLGLTLNCARCHDHMYDPVKQKEYYSFRAFFEPYQIRTDRIPGQSDVTKDGIVRAYDADLNAKTLLFFRGNEALADKDQPCDPLVPAFLQAKPFTLASIPLPVNAWLPDQKQFILEESLKLAQQRLAAAKTSASRVTTQTITIGLALLTASSTKWSLLPLVQSSQYQWESSQAELLVAQITELQAQFAFDRKKAKPDVEPKMEKFAIHQHQLQQRQLNLALARKNLSQLKARLFETPVKKQPPILEQIKAAETAIHSAENASKLPLSDSMPDTATRYPKESTGRRTALSLWITHKSNPLTARVAVNHIWMRHFGQPLVPSVFDFGKNGQPCTHPALLDWLAIEFMESGWSMKKLHKLIVMSKTWQLDSTTDADSWKRDPDNRYYWRRPPQRMEAEVVRDSVLHLSGQLDCVQGGPELDQESGLTTFRRSMYYRHANEKQMTFLTTFDMAGPTECYRRVHSVVPQQALALTNSSLVQQSAMILSRNLSSSLGPQAPKEAFIHALFETIITRLPTEKEQKLCQEFLMAQETQFALEKHKTLTPSERAKASLVQVLLNHHEFVTVR